MHSNDVILVRSQDGKVVPCQHLVLQSSQQQQSIQRSHTHGWEVAFACVLEKVHKLQRTQVCKHQRLVEIERCDRYDVVVRWHQAIQHLQTLDFLYGHNTQLHLL